MSGLVTMFLVGLISVVVASLALALLGIVFHAVVGIGAFLLFKVAPILLVGWIVVRLLSRRRPAHAGVEDDILA